MKHKIGKNMGSRSIAKYTLMYINYINFCYTATSQKGYTGRNTPPARSPATPQKMAGNQNQNFFFIFEDQNLYKDSKMVDLFCMEGYYIKCAFFLSDPVPLKILKHLK